MKKLKIYNIKASIASIIMAGGIVLGASGLKTEPFKRQDVEGCRLDVLSYEDQVDSYSTYINKDSYHTEDYMKENTVIIYDTWKNVNDHYERDYYQTQLSNVDLVALASGLKNHDLDYLIDLSMYFEKITEESDSLPDDYNSDVKGIIYKLDESDTMTIKESKSDNNIGTVKTIGGSIITIGQLAILIKILKDKNNYKKLCMQKKANK